MGLPEVLIVAHRLLVFELIAAENILDRLMQTGEMGATLRAAQSNMGAMPQFNQDTINQDYAATKSTMMQDFNDMLRLVESQGRSSQMERLGGAGSMAADNDRMNALMKRYTPELQKIDDAAYDSAVARATSTMGLINTNRQNTLNEISGLYNPQINAETNLLTGGGTDISNLINTSRGYSNEAGDLATSRSAIAEDKTKVANASLGALLAQVYNRPTPTRYEDIVWNQR